MKWKFNVLCLYWFFSASQVSSAVYFLFPHTAWVNTKRIIMQCWLMPKKKNKWQLKKGNVDGLWVWLDFVVRNCKFMSVCGLLTARMWRCQCDRTCLQFIGTYRYHQSTWSKLQRWLIDLTQSSSFLIGSCKTLQIYEYYI